MLKSHNLFSHTSLDCPFRTPLICSTGNTALTSCLCVCLHVYIYMLTHFACFDSGLVTLVHSFLAELRPLDHLVMSLTPRLDC